MNKTFIGDFAERKGLEPSIIIGFEIKKIRNTKQKKPSFKGSLIIRNLLRIV